MRAETKTAIGEMGRKCSSRRFQSRAVLRNRANSGYRPDRWSNASSTHTLARRPVAPQSALLCANAIPQAIGSVTRVASRV